MTSLRSKLSYVSDRIRTLISGVTEKAEWQVSFAHYAENSIAPSRSIYIYCPITYQKSQKNESDSKTCFRVGVRTK